MTPEQINEIENRWRSVIINNLWPKAERNDINSLMLTTANLTWADIHGDDDLDLLYDRLTGYWDVARLDEEAERFEQRLHKLAPAQQKQRVKIWIRCPDAGCALLEVYREPLPDGAKIYFYAKTRRQTRLFAATRAFGSPLVDPVWFATIGCRHGSGRIGREAVLDLGWCDLPNGANRHITATVPFAGGEHPVLDPHEPHNFWRRRSTT